MIEIKETIKNLDEFNEKILPLLYDEIFHITSFSNYKRILKDGYIKNNGELKYNTTYPQSEGSYFQKRGCICLFDGRKKDKLKQGIIDFNYGKIFDRKSIIMCLTKDEHKNIEIPKRKPGDGTLIQYVEVGYKGKIDIQSIYKTIIITPKREKLKDTKLGQISLIRLNREVDKIQKKGNKKKSP